MEGVLAEGSEMIEEEADEEVRDAGLIAAAQRVEHYEIAGYGSEDICLTAGRQGGRSFFKPHWMRKRN
jgi:ferritin-like metal-binding protein YciE